MCTARTNTVGSNSYHRYSQTPTDDFLEPDGVFFFLVCFVYRKKGSETKKRTKEEIEKSESPIRCTNILSDFMRFDPHYPLMSDSADSNH